MDFIKIHFTDIIDILLVAVLMYQLYRLIRKTNAISIFTGILIIYLIWILVRMLNMELLSWIMGQVIGVGVIALIIVFQPEIRKFLFLLGERYAQRRGSFLGRLFFPKGYVSTGEWSEELAAACVEMSKSYTGALIVIRRNSEVNEFIDTGVKIDAKISVPLIENIFFKNSPLHDGAVVIEDGRIRAARCLLPVSDRKNIPSYYGTRHRAALGATEASDAVVIVVSEERGQISFVRSGTIFGNITQDRLRELLAESLNPAGNEADKNPKKP